ncbi:hypothetical protein ABW20_dc0106390 [Dactylellina cionopaga]|nr:hypothetical protein ABW20_dc0106390 [Dactylellina cionopaga]
MDETYNFIRAIKQYSEKKASHEFTLHLDMRVQGIKLFDLCDISKLTNLKLSAIWWWDIKGATAGLETFIQLLSAVPDQLKVLSLYGGDFQKTPKGLDVLWERLQVLQEVVSNLKSITSLTVESGFLYHPSFLLLPPENVRDLSYGGKMSASWWRKFASYPFIGVERLSLSCESLNKHERKSLRSSGEEIYKSSTEIQLGGVEISGLKWISINESPSYTYPAGLFEHILNKNPQLSSHCLQAIAKNMGSKCAEKVNAKIPEIVNKCGNELSLQLKGAFQRYAEEFATKNLVERRSFPIGFEKEMENTSIELLVKQFENEFSSNFATQCAEILRKQLEEEMLESGTSDDEVKKNTARWLAPRKVLNQISDSERSSDNDASDDGDEVDEVD